MSLLGDAGIFLLGLLAVVGAAWPRAPGEGAFLPEAKQMSYPAVEAPPALPQADSTAPEIGAKAAVVFDRESRSVLWSREADAPRAIASLTKLMTAIVALDRADAGQILTVRASDLTAVPAESLMGLTDGSQLTLAELLHGLLIASGNDAARVIAREIGGNEKKFAALMNEKAAALGLSSTRFINATGLDAEGHEASPRDLAVLADYALRYPEIKAITSKPGHTAKSLSGQSYPLVSTHQLTLSGEAQGVKTGHTLAAGQSAITLEVVESHEILSVVLASPDRFGETRLLYNWARNHVRWQ